LPYDTGGSETEPPPAPDGYAALLLLAPPGDSAAGGAETCTCKWVESETVAQQFHSHTSAHHDKECTL